MIHSLGLTSYHFSPVNFTEGNIPWNAKDIAILLFVQILLFIYPKFLSTICFFFIAYCFENVQLVFMEVTSFHRGRSNDGGGDTLQSNE